LISQNNAQNPSSHSYEKTINEIIILEYFARAVYKTPLIILTFRFDINK
jgi:hypothetical protein